MISKSEKIKTERWTKRMNEEEEKNHNNIKHCSHRKHRLVGLVFILYQIIRIHQIAIAFDTSSHDSSVHTVGWLLLLYCVLCLMLFHYCFWCRRYFVAFNMFYKNVWERVLMLIKCIAKALNDQAFESKMMCKIKMNWREEKGDANETKNTHSETIPSEKKKQTYFLSSLWMMGLWTKRFSIE